MKRITIKIKTDTEAGFFAQIGRASCRERVCLSV